MKINDPNSKAVDIYVKSTAKHSKIGKQLENLAFWVFEKLLFNQIYFRSHGTSSSLSPRSIFSMKFQCSGLSFLQVTGVESMSYLL